MRSVDVLVVGAGPAGTACAIHAASVGLQVTVVAPDVARERPGETLHPGVEPLFDRLGIGEAVRDAGWLRHLGHRVGPEGRLLSYGSDAQGPWRGFQAPTAALDRLLLERVLAAGVSHFTGVAESLLVTGSGLVRRVEGVRVAGTEIAAAVTVDATGPTRFAARALDLVQHMAGPERRVYWGHLAHVPGDLQGEPRFQELQSGWLWRAPIHDSLCAWVWGPHSSATGARAAGRELAEVLGASDVGRIRGALATSILVRPPLGCAGLLLAGDAAFSVTPLAGKGVLRALLMGIAAGEAARRIVSDSASADRLAARYAAWTTQWFEREAAEVAALHPAAPSNVPSSRSERPEIELSGKSANCR